MAKKDLPVYSICSLREDKFSPDDFIADRLSHYLDMHKDLRFPHKHDFYHLVYFASGSGSHSVDFVNFKVTPGQIYFMIPEQVHTWEFKTEPDGYIINFSQQFIYDLVANPRYLDQFSFFSGNINEQVIQLPKKEMKHVDGIFEIIVEEFNGNKEGHVEMIRALLLQLFIVVNRNAVKENELKTTNYNSLTIRNFLKLINTNFKQKRLTKDYAAMLYVTPNHLNALAKDVTGRSAGELIRERVLLEAKRLLVNADMNISQIAHELDFPDNSYFSKFFKKYVGITPEHFRNQINKK